MERERIFIPMTYYVILVRVFRSNLFIPIISGFETDSFLTKQTHIHSNILIE